MQVDLVSGCELKQVVLQRNVNKSPPKKERLSSIKQQEFDDIKTLVWMASSIEQANTEECLTRSNIPSVVDKLANDKRKMDGAHELGDAQLYKRIKKENARQQDHEFIDPRGALRVQWLTYNMQKKHYKNLEGAMSDYGFARMAIPEEIEADGVYLVYHEGQDIVFSNIDEMKFSPDGSVAQSGGRPSATPLDINLPEAGTMVPKLSNSLTIVIGVTAAGEVLPPFFIFSTDAKEKAN